MYLKESIIWVYLAFFKKKSSILQLLSSRSSTWFREAQRHFLPFLVPLMLPAGTMKRYNIIKVKYHYITLDKYKLNSVQFKVTQLYF